jgi:hypothetical protein
MGNLGNPYGLDSKLVDAVLVLGYRDLGRQRGKMKIQAGETKRIAGVESDGNAKDTAHPPRGRRKYAKPVLLEYGDVRGVTLAPSPGVLESGPGAGFRE